MVPVCCFSLLGLLGISPAIHSISHARCFIAYDITSLFSLLAHSIWALEIVIFMSERDMMIMNMKNDDDDDDVDAVCHCAKCRWFCSNWNLWGVENCTWLRIDVRNSYVKFHFNCLFEQFLVRLFVTATFYVSVIWLREIYAACYAAGNLIQSRSLNQMGLWRLLFLTFTLSLSVFSTLSSYHSI